MVNADRSAHTRARRFGLRPRRSIATREPLRGAALGRSPVAVLRAEAAVRRRVLEPWSRPAKAQPAARTAGTGTLRSVNVERLADLCQIAIDTADVHPFKLARADGGAVGARWLRDPRAGTDQDIAQYFASSAGAARVASSWLPDATELVLPVTTFHPLSDNADVALAATQHVALDSANVLVVPDRPVELPNASLHGMTLLCALCSQPERAFEMIAFAQQARNPLVLPHVVVVPHRRPSPDLLRHRGMLLIGKDGEVASFTSVQSAGQGGTALRAAGLALDLVVAALWEHERGHAATP